MFIIYYTDYKQKFDSMLETYSSNIDILSGRVYKDHICDKFELRRHNHFSNSELLFYKDNHHVFWETVFYWRYIIIRFDNGIVITYDGSSNSKETNTNNMLRFIKELNDILNNNFNDNFNDIANIEEILF